jgi:hypothetical protein
MQQIYAQWGQCLTYCWRMYGLHEFQKPVIATDLEELSIAYLALGMHQYIRSNTKNTYCSVWLGMHKA